MENICILLPYTKPNITIWRTVRVCFGPQYARNELGITSNTYSICITTLLPQLRLWLVCNQMHGCRILSQIPTYRLSWTRRVRKPFYFHISLHLFFKRLATAFLKHQRKVCMGVNINMILKPSPLLGCIKIFFPYF